MQERAELYISNVNSYYYQKAQQILLKKRKRKTTAVKQIFSPQVLPYHQNLYQNNITLHNLNELTQQQPLFHWKSVALIQHHQP